LPTCRIKQNAWRAGGPTPPQPRKVDMPRLEPSRVGVVRVGENFPRTSPLRPGLPPGAPPLCLLSRDYLDEHIVLAETHSMAMNTPERRDSS
jgi:hypothetical protein